jgi:uncharacterized phage protein (TIGR02220 family)
MDWYKHSTGSHDDPDVSDAMDEFGHVGYSVFFITLEVYGSEFNHLDSEGWLTISKRFLARKLRLSQAKVEQILNFYSERQRIITKTSKNTISVNCPKFVDIASNWTRRRTSTPTEALQRPYVAPTAKEEEEKKKRREEEYIPPISPKPNHKKIPYQEIIEYLNLKTGKHFSNTAKETRSKIKARWGSNGQQRTIQDFKTVIDNKCAQWLNDEKMSAFLRPETLFGTKFESYLNERMHPLSGQVSDKTIRNMEMLKEWRPPL